MSEEVTAMLHPSGPDAETPLAVRDGAGAPVTCASCGCRLAQTGEAWFHFNPIAGETPRLPGRRAPTPPRFTRVAAVSIARLLAGHCCWAAPH
jgi:hypothetical protein